MKSQWFYLKGSAISLRKEGYSLNKISNRLNIPKSTLSTWLRNVKISKEKTRKLQKAKMVGLAKARKKAVQWHKNQKELRMNLAKKEASEVLSKIDKMSRETLDLALAFLYFGEGFKNRSGTGIGNSDPMILKFFVKAMSINYNIQPQEIKMELHLRADQKPKEMKKYWSKTLGIPEKNFSSISVDQRTKGSKTYPEYKGVCVLRCGSVAIQRKLIYLSKMFCENITNKGAVSSVG